VAACSRSSLWSVQGWFAGALKELGLPRSEFVLALEPSNRWGGKPASWPSSAPPFLTRGWYAAAALVPAAGPLCPASALIALRRLLGRIERLSF